MKKPASKQRSADNKSGRVIHLPAPSGNRIATPALGQYGPEIQKFGTRIHLPIGLNDQACKQSITALNQILADTMTIRDMYKKHHWQVGGATFYQLHLLYDKHYTEQSELIDMIAERIQMLGGVSIAMAKHVAEATTIECPPMGREEAPVQVSRLAAAHETILIESRKAAKAAGDSGDDGTNDILVSNVIRTNEMHVWFLTEHMAPETFSAD